MVRKHAGAAANLSPEQLQSGWRVVDGEITHLDELYRNKYEKLREMIKSIPYTQAKEQIEALQSGKYTMIEQAMDISIHMSRIAILEYEKLRKKKLASTVKDYIFTGRRAKELDRNSMHEEFAVHESELKDVVHNWVKSFETACRINRGKVDITEEQFNGLLKRFSSDEMHATVDNYLPAAEVW